MKKQQKRLQTIVILSISLGLIASFGLIDNSFAEEKEEQTQYHNGDITRPITTGESLNGVTLQHSYEIQVPFDPTGISCELVEEDLVYICFFYGGDEPIELVDELEIGIPDPQPEVIDVDLNGVMSHESETQVIHEEPPKTNVDILIERLEVLEASGEIRPSDQELLNKSREAKKTCQFGIKEGEAIQEKRTFDIPQTAIDITRSFKYDSNTQLEAVATLIQECDHWEKYMPFGLGPEYLKKIKDANDALEAIELRNAYLDELAFQYSPALSDHDLIEQREDAQDTFCDHTMYQNHTKYDYGCIDIEVPENRGGYTDTSQHPLVLQYLQSKETGINVVNPDETPDNYLSPLDKAKSYMKAYPADDIPLEIIKELSSEEFEKLKQWIAQEGETQ